MADLAGLLDVTRLRLGRSLQSKLAALFSTVFAVIAVILNIYLPQKFERQAVESLDARGLATANLAAYAVQPGIQTDDLDALEDALGAVMKSSAVEYVTATDMRGRVLATAGALDSGFEGRIEGEGLVRQGGSRAHVTVVQIPSASGPVGRITIALSAAPFEAARREGRWTAAVVSIGILVFGLLAVAVISVNVTRPLVGMVGTAERIASGDLAHRAAETGQDEVGQLAVAFNRMVDRVQAGQKAHACPERTVPAHSGPPACGGGAPRPRWPLCLCEPCRTGQRVRQPRGGRQHRRGAVGGQGARGGLRRNAR